MACCCAVSSASGSRFASSACRAARVWAWVCCRAAGFFGGKGEGVFCLLLFFARAGEGALCVFVLFIEGFGLFDVGVERFQAGGEVVGLCR